MVTASEMPPLTSTVGLKCRSCGAPLPADPTGEILRCEHCGTAQRVVDARAFVDQIALQINSFLRQALPMGAVGAAGGGAIDPVARHNLFVQGVRPRLDTEFREMRFRCFNLLSHGQMALPFTVTSWLTSPEDPKGAFLFQEKVRSVRSLAVDEESQGYLSEIEAIATAYAYLLTNAGFLSQVQPERYPFVARNCREASQALQNTPKLKALELRLSGLSFLAEALDQLSQGNPQKAREPLRSALPPLTQAREIAFQNFDQSVMIGGIDEDIAIAKASLVLTDVLTPSGGGDAGRSLQTTEVLLRTLNSPLPGGEVNTATLSAARLETLLTLAAQMRKAQSGQGAVRVLNGPGEIFVAFWVVEVPYSFSTGALWKARGVEVSETMLVASTFPLARPGQGPLDPSSVVTDVFAARGPSSWRDRVAGRETAISGGGIVRQVVAGSASLPLPDLPCVPPLSTQDEASRLVQEYLTWSRQRDAEIDQKLKLSLPRVVDLVYLSCVPGRPGSPPVPFLGPLSPRTLGDPGALHALAFT